MNSRIRRPLLLRSDVGSEQQHNQDLREIYKGERVLEFITFYQNALHLTTFFYQNALHLTMQSALRYLLPKCIAPLPWVPETFLARFPVSLKSL